MNGSGTAQKIIYFEHAALRCAAALSVLGALCWLPMAWGAAAFLAALIEGRPALLGLLGLFGVFGLMRAGFAWVCEGMAQRAALREVGAQRSRLLHQIPLRQELPEAGRFASVIGEQAELILPYAARYGLAYARVAVMPLVILVTALTLSWAAALILILTGPVIPLFMALIGYAAEKASIRQLGQMGSMSALLADRIAALPDVRLLGASVRLVDQFRDEADRLRRRTMRVLSVAFLSSTVLELFAALGIAIMAVYCGFSLLGSFHFGTWGPALSIHSGLFLLLIAPEFYQPLRDLAASWHDRASAQAAAEQMAALGLDGAKPQGPIQNVPPTQLGAHLAGGISLRGLVCGGIAYPDLDLPSGGVIAITGPSGAGKTTLLRLLAGLVPPDQGQILLGGVPMAQAGLAQWRAGLGWMPQSVHFLDASLAENLTMGRRGDLDPALRAAHASHLIPTLPQGLETRLGERGAGLSGGEARRLTLARALFGAPKWILADEPTADLDRDSARAVIQGLLAAHQDGAGLIVATHDPDLIAAIGHDYRIGGR